MSLSHRLYSNPFVNTDIGELLVITTEKGPKSLYFQHLKHSVDQ
jgi:hypothetical protein